MTKNFKDTIYLFACAAKGIDPKPLDEPDYSAIYRLSQSQGIWDTVFLSVKRLQECGHGLLDEENFQNINSHFMMHFGWQIRKQAFIHKLITKLENEGVNCCILKGEAVSRYYHTPIARSSTDTDILVEKNSVGRCLEILEETGFQVGDAVYESHQIECTHPVSGLVEIHTQMYGNKTNDVAFHNIVKYEEPYTVFTAEDGMQMTTLGKTDTAMFLLMHFLKHFLSAGAGLRQLTDFLLFIENNYKDLNWDRIYSDLEKLSFTQIFHCIITIGMQYFEFPKDIIDIAEVEPSLIDRMLTDIEEGGLFGFDDSKRAGFYELYLQQRYHRFNHGEYSSYVQKRKLTRLFPNRKFMSINFPYVERSVLLLPVAWLHRIVKGIFSRKDQSSAVDMHHTERLKLMKDLKMI